MQESWKAGWKAFVTFRMTPQSRQKVIELNIKYKWQLSANICNAFLQLNFQHNQSCFGNIEVVANFGCGIFCNKNIFLKITPILPGSRIGNPSLFTKGWDPAGLNL